MIVQYCPQCGTPTIKREDGGRLRDVCPSCNWIHYSEMAIGVGALILRGDRVLLVERGIPPVGVWTLPSGWIEQDDTLATAVVREVQEETALDCTPQGIICVRNLPKAARNETYVCFLCEVDPAAEPIPDGDESTQARFVPVDALDTVNISTFSRYLVEQYWRDRPQPWPLNRTFDRFDVYPNAAVFAPF